MLNFFDCPQSLLRFSFKAITQTKNTLKLTFLSVTHLPCNSKSYMYNLVFLIVLRLEGPIQSTSPHALAHITILLFTLVSIAIGKDYLQIESNKFKHCCIGVVFIIFIRSRLTLRWVVIVNHFERYRDC